ncbi:MAG TPA: universal stress protein [Bacteroidales bacterium]|jgi:nucleotide-binding universal stress UspA family protein|nr:universal stress protein [Bacteroidales bacterium]HQQ01776.1 universal stress protein [Bacteroidales bacterium]
MKNKNTILVPTDFTEVANNAIHQASEAARYLGFRIILLHVIDKNTKTALKKENLSEETINQRLQDICNQITITFGIQADYIAREGNIFTTIGEVAKEIDARLIYMGTHGKVGLEQKITGSYALKVIISCPAPVIVVQKKTFSNGYHKIVLPITSANSLWEKTKWAAYIATGFNAVIYIYQFPGEDIKEAVQTIATYFNQNGIRYQIKEAEKSSDLSKLVIDYATSIEADLIMIMTNPEKGLPSFIFGSYDEDIIFNTSQIPVMCVNPRELTWNTFIDY